VNADDFGFTAGVNRGILEAHAAGVVSSVSVLVNTPGWPDARDHLRTARGTLGVGLHLNLTSGAPLTTAPSLASPRTGRFHSLSALVARALTGRLDASDVAAECRAQLARLRGAGMSVTHIDSHRHVHVLPGVWGVVIEIARREGVPVVRVPLEPLSTAATNGRALLKQAALAAAWGLASGGRLGGGDLRAVDRFYGISLQGDPRFLTRVLALLDGLEPGTTELMVHPGHPDGDLAGWDDYTAPRAAELAALTSPVVRARFASGAFRLVHFGAL
jgi:chitin disaccharide deacetylase